jgi:hypothetical protein
MGTAMTNDEIIKRLLDVTPDDDEDALDKQCSEVAAQMIAETDICHDMQLAEWAAWIDEHIWHEMGQSHLRKMSKAEFEKCHKATKDMIADIVHSAFSMYLFNMREAE